jgi:probable F420-dependent oxidoreductase
MRARTAPARLWAMKYALGLYQHHPIDPAFATPEFIQSFTRTADEAGFDAVYFTEHPMPGNEWLATGGHDALDPFVALAFAAATSPRLRLLTNLTVLPYRNPFLLAKTVATLDRLSGGRVTLGVGTGYLMTEFAALGVDFDERNDLFDEVLAGCRAAWTGHAVTMTGKHFDAPGNTALPTPVQDPLPVWIGGNATISLRRVAEHAQGWMPLLNPRSLANRRRSAHLETLDDLERLLDKLHAFRAAAGRADEPLDVLWFNLAGQPGAPGWRLDAYAAEQDRQKALGVTWSAVNCSGATPDDALAMARTFGEQVIAALR